MTIAKRLKEERKRLGYSQTGFAKLGCVGRSSHIKYETGERSPDTKYLESIYQHGADVGYILTGKSTHNIEVIPEKIDLIFNIAKEFQYKLTRDKLKSFLLFAVEQDSDEYDLKRIMTWL